MTRTTRSLRWLGVRVAGAVVVLWAVSTVIFFAVRSIPGEPAEAVLGGPGSQTSPEALEAVRERYGLDQPLIVQYFAQLGRLAVFDLGDSYSLKMPVSDVLGQQLGATILLSIAALALAWICALGWALLTAGRRGGGGWRSSAGGTVEVVIAVVPHFVLATVLILVFSSLLGWLPAVSDGTPLGLVLPVLTLAVPLAGFLGQVMREGVQASVDSGYSLSAMARGESMTGVRLRHAIRHAALPAVALSGWAFGALVSGTVVVENIFALPGLGRTLLSAVTVRDVPLVTGVALVSALAYVLVMAVADLVESALRPDLREQPA